MFNGAKVKARREALGLTQQMLGVLIGVEQGTISKIESGKRISLVMAQKIAWALKCTLDELL